jgi:mxaK protein
MAKNIKNRNLTLTMLVVIGLVGAIYEAYQCYAISTLNKKITAGKIITDENYPYLQKYTAAYDQGNKSDYKHAIQTYSQLLDQSPSLANQAKIHFNIGNNLFIFGLIRRVNEDGTYQDEARHAYMQAKIAYEQSLRIEPTDISSKFNLSLLNSIMSKNMNAAPKEQSTMELSNLPIGLP